MSKIIEAEGLTKAFPPSAKAVDGVTPRGLEFLDTYFKMKGFLEEFRSRLC